MPIVSIAALSPAHLPPRTSSHYLKLHPSKMIPESSAGKESACNAGDLGSVTGLGRSPGEGNSYPLQYSGLENSMDCTVHGVTKSQTQLSDWTELNWTGGSAGKESAWNVGDLGSVTGLGRSPGEGKGYPLQYSGLENSMDCTVHWVTKSRTRLSCFHSLTVLCQARTVLGDEDTAVPKRKPCPHTWVLEEYPRGWAYTFVTLLDCKRRVCILTF